MFLFVVNTTEDMPRHLVVSFAFAASVQGIRVSIFFRAVVLSV